MTTSLGITPLLSPLALFASNAIDPTGTLFGATNAATPGLLGGPSAIVELSAQGQLLGAVSGFAFELAQIQPGSPNSNLGSNFGTDFASLAAEAQSFVDAFNGLQGSLNGLAGIGAGSDALAQALNSEAGASLGNGGSSLTQLADLGITVQSTPTGGSALGIDLAKLNSAFTSDQAGSFGLLSQAINGFASLAQDFTAQSSSLFSISTSAADLATSSLLTNLGLTSSLGGLGGSGLASLLMLESLGQGNASSAAQALLAVNQFQLVSSLLGA